MMVKNLHTKVAHLNELYDIGAYKKFLPSKLRENYNFNFYQKSKFLTIIVNIDV